MGRKLTIADLRALKGGRKIVMTNAADYNTARAAEEAGVDIIGGRGLYNESQMCLVLDQLRLAAPETMIACNLPATTVYVSDSEIIRCAMLARDHGADLVYSSGNSLARFRALASVGIPFGGHVGLVPIAATWIGGIRAVGKTRQEALDVYRAVKEFEEAGAVLVEVECVPEAVAAAITSATNLLTVSLGSGQGCDGQFLFSSDLLGTYEGRYPGLARPYEGRLPRHAKQYINLYGLAVDAFKAFKRDVEQGAYPASQHSISISPAELAGFIADMESRTGPRDLVGEAADGNKAGE
jgi:3-methyl-2-oxobutanoate hydroxymethyltransferase